MNKQIFVAFFLIINFGFFFISCTEEEEKAPEPSYQQFNISVLLDLSDRIEPELNPGQIEKDQEIILSILDVLKGNMKSKNTYYSLDKFRIIFYPQPEEAQLSSIASNLNFDLEKLQVKERKKLYQNIDSTIKNNVNLLYSAAIKDKSYPGADIWRFFKDEVQDKCIINKPNYQNYLIILTDGYVYWKNTKNSKKNRYSYILPTSPHINVFRKDPDWQKTFKEKDYGMLSTGQTFEGLKVLVLEVNATKKYPQDYDIIKEYLGSWFEEMNIKENDYKILKADLPTYTKPIIEKFLTKWK